MARVTLLAALLLACNSGQPPPPPCGSSSFSFFSPCGFQAVTTTCANGMASCEDAGPEAFCSIGAVTTNCTVSVVLGDGTHRDVSVTVAPSTDPSCQGVTVVTTPTPIFTSPTCSLPDAGGDGD